jgi:membrane-associated protease RseP (regulator of RpoE activity)
MKLPPALFLACLATASVCGGQEDSKPAPCETEAQPGQAPTAEPQAPNGTPVTYIGVMTRDVPPEVRAQFSLPPGFGIVVDGVMPDSPALQAGIKEHDVLVKLDDQQLVSIEQLMILVRAKTRGDVVRLTVISGGEEKQVPVTLGEHLMPETPARHLNTPGFAWPQGSPPVFEGDSIKGFRKKGQALGEDLEKFQQEMQAFQKRVQDWAKNGAQGPMPQPPTFKAPQGMPPKPGAPPPIVPAADVQQFSFSESHAASTVTRRDDSGEYALEREDGSATFIARPNGGTEQSWPVNTDAERAAVPKEFQEKLRIMTHPVSGP